MTIVFKDIQVLFTGVTFHQYCNLQGVLFVVKCDYSDSDPFKKNFLKLHFECY